MLSAPEPSLTTCDAFLAPAVVAWQRVHGRHNLPWQNTHDPYSVWLSEIMLQQTQVATVCDYFLRFVQRFPDVHALAHASQDDVLGLWSGLGYYSRARNLHRCAQAIEQLHGGEFPRQAEQLVTLPGIGRSTAAAIASLCFGQPVAILDGNVKRVLTRYLGFDADLSVVANERLLWQRAQALLPHRPVGNTMANYTQGMMDLGATLCTSKKPACVDCPLRTHCQAHAAQAPESYPVKTRRVKRSSQSLWLLWAQAPSGAVWLSQRPTPGVWAGLYCFSLFDDPASLHQSLGAAGSAQARVLPGFKHVLTHKDLHLHPVQVPYADGHEPALPGAWFAASSWPTLGLPAPIRKMLLVP